MSAVTIGAEGIRALNRRLAERDGPGYKASPEDQAAAVLQALRAEGLTPAEIAAEMGA